MNKNDWFAVLTRIVPDGPVDLDRIWPSGGVPQVQAPDWPAPGSPAPPPSSRLWQRRTPGAASLGVRISQPLPDPGAAALRLATAAVERAITPIILSAIEMSGFERFGFRVERLPAEPALRAEAERELARFWDLSLIIDAQDIGLLK